MTKWLKTLSWEQWAIVAVSAAVLTMGLPWGLPNHRRMELLLGGSKITGEQANELRALRESYYEKLDAAETEAGRRLLRGERPNSSSTPLLGESRSAADWLFTPEERLVAFRSFIVGSAAADEQKPFSALSRMKPSRLDFDPRIYIYGGTYLYPLGAILFGLRGGGLLRVTNDFGYYLNHPGNIAIMYMAGRFMNVAAFVGILILLARLGARFPGRYGATAAMGAWACSTLALNQTLVSKPHIYAAFWALLSLYWLLRHLEHPSWQLLLLSAAAAGWAFGASVPCGVLALLYPLLLFDPTRRWDSLRSAAAAIAVMGAVFLITNPYVVLSFGRYLLTLTQHSSREGWGYSVVSERKTAGFLEQITISDYGFPVSLVGAFGWAWSAWRGEGVLRRLAWAAALVCLLVGLTVGSPRVTLFLGPWVCLFAGVGFARLAQGLSRAPLALRAALAGCLFALPVFFAALFARDVIRDEAWYEPVRAWVTAAHVSDATTIGVLRAPAPTDMPSFPFVNARLVDMSRLATTTETVASRAGQIAAAPDFVVIGNYADDRALWDRHPLRGRYRLAYDLGYRPSYEWLLALRAKSESRVAGWVYERRNEGG